MPTDRIRGDYAQLDTIASRFVALASQTAALTRAVRAQQDVLSGGDWIGQGARKFYAEMDGQVLPTLARLQAALEEARAVTLKIKDEVQRAEAEAARILDARPGDGAHRQAVAAYSGGGGGGGGSEKKSDPPWYMEAIHGVLDVAGFVPGFGEVADGINALIYLGEGRYLEAGISAAAMIPVVGDVGKIGKYGVKIGKEVVETLVERTAKETVETLVERTAKETVETLVERTAKETAENAGERIVRDGADDLVKFGDLAPNATYVKNGVEYTTDASGRLTSVEGTLDVLEKAPRNAHQTEVGKLGNTGDVGGHMFGSRFNGPSEGYNLVPQNGKLNNSEWKAMENEWARAIDAGKDVKVHMRLEYPATGGSRPDRFNVEYEIDGILIERIFINQPGG